MHVWCVRVTWYVSWPPIFLSGQIKKELSVAEADRKNLASVNHQLKVELETQREHKRQAEQANTRLVQEGNALHYQVSGWDGN